MLCESVNLHHVLLIPPHFDLRYSRYRASSDLTPRHHDDCIIQDIVLSLAPTPMEKVHPRLQATVNLTCQWTMVFELNSVGNTDHTSQLMYSSYKSNKTVTIAAIATI